VLGDETPCYFLPDFENRKRQTLVESAFSVRNLFSSSTLGLLQMLFDFNNDLFLWLVSAIPKLSVPWQRNLDCDTQKLKVPDRSFHLFFCITGLVSPSYLAFQQFGSTSAMGWLCNTSEFPVPIPWGLYLQGRLKKVSPPTVALL
jgi:hypothetical protein